MMKKLLKKNHLLLLLLLTATSSFAQFTVSFDNVPAEVEVSGGLDPNDVLVITVDNIPDDNVHDGSTGIVVQIRMVPNGTESLGTTRITQMDLDTDYNTPDGGVDANHSIVTVTGTDADTFKRTFTITTLVPLDDPVRTFTDGNLYYAGVRVKNRNITGSASNNEFRHEATSGNSWAGSIEGVADNTLSISSNETNISRSIYPNPVSSILNISKSVNTKTYKVVNLLGKIVKDVSASGNLDVSDLSADMYILVTDAGQARFVKK